MDPVQPEPDSQSRQGPDAVSRGLARFGHTHFRMGQREAIDALLKDARLLMVAPTGGGKSLSYQLPALLLPGTTLVISPLISLMQDQVSALEALGIDATYLASTLDPARLDARLRKLAEGHYKLAYVSPERLANPAFRAVLGNLDCSLVAIDEAHCISEWGHDFRPDYMQIKDVLARLPNARVLACTATATPIVRDEIIERLGLPPETQQLVSGFARPNLALRVHDVKGRADRTRWVDDALEEVLGQPDSARGAAIIYAPTRRQTESEYERLRSLGWRVAPYHAGLEGEVRDLTHHDFSTAAVDIVVATNAFGMGIDRADVRGVIHLAAPGSIEAYYQEVGRAGRDGEPAIGLMLLSPDELPRRRYLIDRDGDGDAEVIRHKWELFLELMRFAEGGSCRHDAVLRYFGDEAETLSGCGRCDVCLRLATGEEGGDFDAEQSALIVRKALSGVARVHGRFGLKAAVALVKGKEDPRLVRDQLHTTSTFGILGDFSEDWVTQLLRRCVTAGWVDFFGADRPVVVLTEEGIATMRGQGPVRLLLPPLGRPSAKGSQPGKPPATAPASDNPGDSALFEALRSHRLEIARAHGVPPYVVASDRSLRDLAQLRPWDLESLQEAHGIGPSKAERYGEGLLEVIRAHRD